LDCGKETLEHTGVRELEEETSLKSLEKDLKLFGVYSDPKRDPRGHVISHSYWVSEYSGKVKAADDAKKAEWFSIYNLPKLAFDHEKIVRDYCKWRHKLK
jgi:8-oxo-dGTP diphosphatase